MSEVRHRRMVLDVVIPRSGCEKCGGPALGMRVCLPCSFAACIPTTFRELGFGSAADDEPVRDLRPLRDRVIPAPSRRTTVKAAMPDEVFRAYREAAAASYGCTPEHIQAKRAERRARTPAAPAREEARPFPRNETRPIGVDIVPWPESEP